MTYSRFTFLSLLSFVDYFPIILDISCCRIRKKDIPYTSKVSWTLGEERDGDGGDDSK